MVLDGPGFDGGYHYRGRADVFYAMGDAFGKAMVGMLRKKPVDHSAQVAKACEQARKRLGLGK